MSKEFRIGLIALVSGGILYYGFSFLKGTDVLSRSDYYYTTYGNVGSLTASNLVKINGVPVGKVTKIKLLPEEGNKVLVQFDVLDGVELNKGTVAELTSDLLGVTSIVLHIGEDEAYLAPGDTVASRIDKGLAEIIESARPVATNLNVTINNLNKVLTQFDGIGDSLKAVLGNVSKVTTSLTDVVKKNESNMHRTAADIGRLIIGLNNRVEQLEPLLTNTNELVQDDLRNTLKEMNGMITQLNALAGGLERGEGTLGKILKSDTLHDSLNQVLIDLDKVLVHFNEYPKDFLKPLGRKHNKLEGLSEE